MHTLRPQTFDNHAKARDLYRYSIPSFHFSQNSVSQDRSWPARWKQINYVNIYVAGHKEKICVQNYVHTKSSSFCSEFAFSNAFTINHEYLFSAMSVPNRPVSLGSPKQSRKSSCAWNNNPISKTSSSISL